jgi:hypothetical protein
MERQVCSGEEEEIVNIALLIKATIGGEKLRRLVAMRN